MPAITAADAFGLAQERLTQLARSANEQFEFLVDETREVEQGWVFFFNSVDFVRTRNPLYALAGNGPIFVSLEGKILSLPSSIPWEDSLRQYLLRRG